MQNSPPSDSSPLSPQGKEVESALQLAAASQVGCIYSIREIKDELHVGMVGPSDTLKYALATLARALTGQ